MISSSSVFIALLLATPALCRSILLPQDKLRPDQPPLLIWHGLGDNYDADGLKSVGDLAQRIHPGTFVYNIRLDEDPGQDRSATFFGNVTEQIAQVCEVLKEHEVLSAAPVINGIGFSQGGQFLRGLVQRCDWKAQMNNLITFGSQHNGIDNIHCKAGDWVCKGVAAVAKANTWTNYAQSHLVPAQYYRTINDTTVQPTPEYLEHSNFLADINNEREEKNTTYAERIAELNKFVMLIFTEDQTVVPKESGWFMEVVDDKKIALQDRMLYKEDWLGLRKLDKKGGLVFGKVKGAHMELSEKVLKPLFEDYLGPLEKLTVQRLKEGAMDRLQTVLDPLEL